MCYRKVLIAVLALLAFSPAWSQPDFHPDDRLFIISVQTGINTYRSPQEVDFRSGSVVSGCNNSYEDLQLRAGLFGSVKMELGLGKYVSLVQDLGLFQSRRSYSLYQDCPYLSVSTTISPEKENLNMRSETGLRIHTGAQGKFRGGLDVGLALNRTVGATTTVQRITSEAIVPDNEGYIGLLSGFFVDYLAGRHNFGLQTRLNTAFSKPSSDYESRQIMVAAMAIGISYGYRLR